MSDPINKEKHRQFFRFCSFESLFFFKYLIFIINIGVSIRVLTYRHIVISLAWKKKGMRRKLDIIRFWQLISGQSECLSMTAISRGQGREAFFPHRREVACAGHIRISVEENWNSRSFAKWVRLGRVRLGNYIPSASRVGTTLKLLTNFQLTSSTFGATSGISFVLPDRFSETAASSRAFRPAE